MDALGLEPCLRGQLAQDQERACARQRAAAGVEEQVGPVAAVEVRAAEREVAAHGLGCRAAERDDALLVALADHAHDARVDVDRRAGEADRLRDAQARRRTSARRARGRASPAASSRSPPRSGARTRTGRACAAACGSGAASRPRRPGCRRAGRAGPDGETPSARPRSGGRSSRARARRRASRRPRPRATPSSPSRQARRGTWRALRGRGGRRRPFAASAARRGGGDSAPSRGRPAAGRGSSCGWTRFGVPSRASCADRRARMTAVVHAPQPARVDVAVDLGRRERGVPEQLLDRAQVGAAFEQVRGVRVAEPVGIAHQAAQDVRCRAPARGRRGTACRWRRARGKAARRGDSVATAYAARSPSGTMRSLPPLPSTCTASCSKSTSASRSPTTSAVAARTSTSARASRRCASPAGRRPRPWRGSPRPRRASARPVGAAAASVAGRSRARGRRRA